MHATGSREKQGRSSAAVAAGSTASANKSGGGALRHVLVVDDEESLRHMLIVLLKREGYEATAVASGEQALAELEQRPYDVVLSDIRMPKLGGLELVDEIKKRNLQTTIILMSAFGNIDVAIEAMKRGAYDYVSKPFRPDEVVLVLKKAEERERLFRENAALKQQLARASKDDARGLQSMIARGPKMEEIFRTIKKISEYKTTVLITGESGTGKELVARAIHAQSKRRFLPLVTVNAGSLPETLLESELFGHEKGAYTGAQYRRKGKVELANGGTLFLDEIGDVSAKTQIDLLRVLETHRFTRLGGNQEITSDFRLVCATHRNLEKLVEDGAFREDLFYRINVFSIELPPLRERPEDILPLTAFFVEKYAHAMGKPVLSISPAAEAVLRGHRWPGNVRELENAIERAMVVGRGPALEAHDLPLAAQNGAAEGPESRSLAALEKEHISRVLRECDGNITHAAKVLRIDRATLYNKLRRHGLRR